METYRISIQWSRLIYNFEKCSVNKDAYEFYLNYFKEIKKRKIKLIVNLHHFDTPYEIFKNGGWENKNTIELYLKYAKKCFGLFGDIVDEWATFNEPSANVECQYLYGFHFPKVQDFKRSIQVYFNLMVAHSKTVNYFKTIYPNKKITIIVSINPAYPRSQNKADLQAAEFRNMIFVYFQLNLILKGTLTKQLENFLKQYDLIPQYFLEEFEEIKKAKIDYIALNYYQPSRVKAKETKKIEEKIMPLSFYDYYEWPKRRINPHRGWEIYPQGLYDLAMLIKNEYDNFAWMISENGMGVENEEKFKIEVIINDDYRIEFIEEHLQFLKIAIDQGSNCFGYSLWTFIDCWSWANAFKNRYGIVEYDLENKKTFIKKSGIYISELIKLKSQ
ncbi:glycoside hydrolase family 1 protein [Spiroplasma endosymbiont of Atherix ibis]|uniref:glycoside hydrolase family 1 protein n=1 Tax=Spiroplasma endosymbiont of Atherix ibis TaxID=3066291 RepID=UPI0030CC263A